MNGGDTIRCIRADQSLPQPQKFVIVTAYGREAVFKLVEQVGVDHILAKPISPSSLLDAILPVLERNGLPGLRLLDHEGMEADTSPDFSGARVLLVEDNELNREFVREFLHGMNLVVHEACDGNEAVAMVQQGDYALVLMDVQMPVLDGLEATRRIRALAAQSGGARFAALPIIALTALAMPQDEVNIRDAGMSGHIAKPVDLEQVAAALAKWLPVVQHPVQIPLAVDPSSIALSTGREAPPLIDTTHASSPPDCTEGLYRLRAQKAHAYYTTAVSQLPRLISESDLAAWEAYCHDLKGVSGVLGARPLFTCVTELYGLVRKGQRPEPAHVERLRQRLEEVIAEVLAENAGSHPSDAC